MSPRDRRLPWRLTALVVAATVVPLAVLGWLGYRLVAQDRVLESRQVQQRLERTADLAVLALDRAISATESDLATSTRPWPDGVVALKLQQPNLPEAPEGLFAAIEDIEFRQARPGDAAVLYARMVASAERGTQAGALVRLVRALRSAGRTDEALTAARRLDAFDDVAVGGVPASLIGIYSRAVLSEGRDQVVFQQATARLLDGLSSGRWRLSASVYRLYAADAIRWRGGTDVEAGERELLAEAVAVLSMRLPLRAALGSPRELIELDGHPIVVSWRKSEAPAEALLFAPSFVKSRWLPEISAAAHDTAVTITLQAGSWASGPTHSGDSSGARAERVGAETGLPWRVTVRSVVPPPEQAAFALRRTLLLTGLSLVALLTVAAGVVLVRAVRRQAALSRMQSDFVAAVSHEFRTPLTSLRQFTDMLIEQPALDADRRRQAYDAQSRATDRLTRLVESLLDFGRIEAGARRYHLVRQDLDEIVRRAVDDFEPEATRTGHDITFSSSGGVRIPLDDEALSRALRNLLDNAVKYSPEPRPIEVGLERRNGHARVSVRDRGIGIDASERHVIFERFRRGTRARDMGITGTGIGLAMVAEIAAAHHGSVEVESTPGEGSTFTLVLPVEE